MAIRDSEWLSERRRRLLQKEDIDIRRRIELIQDFEMPTASTNIEISGDGNYILASGCYKPRIKCYDVSQMSMKFERCLDSDIVKFRILSDNYSKWLSERRRRLLQKEDIDIRRRIELIQDFEMPTASTNIEISGDGNYILASGCYKPRIKCYDVSQMSMKFERCLDSDIVKFRILSDNYSKLVFLNCDRYVEFHAQYGRYYRTRIPKFGRDLVYHYPSCDLYLVGQSSEIYRLNLEQGRFLNPLQTEAESINCCDINPVHQLLAVGTSQGQVECWDPRSRTRVGQLDVASSNLVSESGETQLPEVTTLKYRDGLMLGLGTSTGHVLLYDIRSDKPMLIKDHQYGLPINSVAFQNDVDMVLSTDSKILKIWHRDTGKPFTAVEPGTNINDLCVCPNSGLLFMATEAPKMLIYYIPSLGPAPRWCSFLDSLTEELEEDAQPVVYDDYKFVTKQDLENLGLSHLIGTNLLRAYMHGFFIDIRLYHKAKAIAEPFAYEDYRKNRIKQKIEEERSNRVIAKKLPKVNRQLAEKLLDGASESRKLEKVNISNPLGDDRFASIFTNPDFQVDETSEQYQLLHPVISKRDKEKKEKQKDIARHLENFDEVADEEVEGVASEDDESSSEDDYEWRQELKKQQNELRKNASSKQPKFYELKSGEEFTGVKNTGDERRTKMVSLGDRLGEGLDTSIIRSSGSSFGGKEIVFKVQKNKQEMEKEDAAKAHRTERRNVRRSVNSILPKEKRGGVFWRGKRVR